jgi:hypothetical protein
MRRISDNTTCRIGLFSLAAIFLLSSLSFSDNAIDIGHQVCGIFNPPGYPMDTIWAGGTPSSIDIYIENDQLLGGIEIAYKIWSPDGATWDWDSAILEIIPIPDTDPPEFDTTWSIVTVTAGSRMYPASEVWDDAGLQVDEINIDGAGYDTICISGLSTLNGLPPGLMERQLLLHLTTGGVAESQVATICIDSANTETGCDFVFIDAEAQSVPPDILWPEGGKCFAVKTLPNCVFAQFIHSCPIMAGDLSVCEIGGGKLAAECVWCEWGYAPEWSLIGNTGNGDAWVSYVGYVMYVPSPLDVGQDIVVTVAVSCPCASESYCSVIFHVTGSMPTIEAGLSYEYTGINNIFVKNDVLIDDPDECIPYQYQITSGPGDIDSESGIYSWTPVIEDVGHHEIEIAAVYQEKVIVSDGFAIDVVDDEDNFGDANCDGGVNIGDAVFLLNHIFHDGPRPPIANWGDTNADCGINVGDAVYLLNQVFHDGPEPLQGCVE